MSLDSPHLPLRFELLDDGQKDRRVAWINPPGPDARLNADELREMALGLLDAARDLSRKEPPASSDNGGSAH